MDFKLISDFKPTGDQPTAIKQLVEGINNGEKHQTLLGVTGSGKTFTAANVIKEVNKPTLILSHNKTLAAQLYGEFKSFFPENKVEYFVSYYDYYQPEAYIPVTGTYIEKDLSINEEIEKLRLSATSALLSGRRDIIVVSSVSCIYGIGNPSTFKDGIMKVSVGDMVSRNSLLLNLVNNLYSRDEKEFSNGSFRVVGDTVDINLPYADIALKISFWGDEIESLETFDPSSNQIIESFNEYLIYPANIFVTAKDTIQDAIHEIQADMVDRVEYFREVGQPLEAKRLEERVTLDLEMIRELGYCSGIENYSRYFDRRAPGTRPFCLLDYFPDDFLMIIDESHVTIPQIRAMYGGDRSRKKNLVEYGFRLPAAMDNRPLKFEEFESIIEQTIYVSATPADYELEKSEGIVAEQLIRPTGLLDPKIYVRPSKNQIDDLLEEVNENIKKDERVLITTLTKRMAEELQKYLEKLSIRSRYIHSDVDTLDRVEIIEDLREGLYDVLVGVNLLREGLDLPEVSLIIILDADKEGFLRSERALVQTVGRAARNVNGRVIMYADKITDSMQRTIDETERRRAKQMAYNEEHNITPTAIKKKSQSVLATLNKQKNYEKAQPSKLDMVAEEDFGYLTKNQIEEKITKTQSLMEKAAKDFDFIEAAKYRDQISELKKML